MRADQMQIEPKDFVEQDKIDRYQDENMFFQSIKFITTVKHGPFAEHSNQLWNISSVQTWNKVNSGLIKMYQAEVLMKFPVVQHILFGSLIDISPI
jgi:serine/threonine-protein phosphatase 2A activator